MLPQHTGRRLALASAVAVAAGTALAVTTTAEAATGAGADHLLLSQVEVTSAATGITLARVTGTGAADGAAITLPTALSGTNKPVTLEGDSAAVGALARSADGRYVTLAGYSAVPGAATASAPRVVARVDAAGTVDSSTTLGTSFTQEKVRGAITGDGTRFWVTGHGATAAPAGGLVSVALGASTGTVLASGSDALNNTRTVQLADGAVWFGSEKGSAGLYRLAGSSATRVVPIGADGSGPVSFVLLDRDAAVTGSDTIYVLREGDGVYKYSSDGSAWTSRGKISSTSGWTGLTGVVDGTSARLYGINGDGAKNTLVQLTDTAKPAATASISSRSTVATAASGVAFRGVALAPGGVATPSPSTSASSSATPSPSTSTSSATPSPSTSASSSATPSPSTSASSSATPTPSASTGQPTSTPTIGLSTAYLSGSVGGNGDPAATVTVAQTGGDANALTVTASASSRTAVATTADVTVTGTGGTRQIAVAPRGRGYTDLTLKVTAPNGKSATTTLHYAASAAVQDAAGTRYLTGASDSSAAIDAGDGYLIAADDETNVLRLYRRDASGAPVRTWDFSGQAGVSIEMDLEAAARTGDTVYWAGSQGNSKSGELRPDRTALFTTKVTGTGANTQLTFGGVYHGLRADLIAWDQANGNRYGFAAGAAAGNIPKQIDGFNLEGLEFAPGSTGTAYLGFRAPLIGGRALLVPVTNLDKLTSGAKATFGTAITMDLAGLSIRDIRANAAGQYLIVAGSWAADDNSDPYALYSWDGVAAHAPVLVRSLPTADPGGWEAIVAVPDLTVAGARAQLVTDAGAADLYGDGTEAKDLTHAEWKKSRATWFTVN
ncbi:DUF3616 domain-containing protein [Actinoplanes palleronii]|uniref:DUF3616 domain-containing protein n=1 Tax=Actinoplanes palleronii TaxID=113570 RepID=A0ABQ4B668_9ACTN|nr:DUF3616 domain-containing protein [Actinoplanes palleronii]GIE66135.1 hypothetical protein Apa02nite_022430 [Actinoplanes palleronii]